MDLRISEPQVNSLPRVKPARIDGDTGVGKKEAGPSAGLKCSTDSPLEIYPERDLQHAIGLFPRGRTDHSKRARAGNVSSGRSTRQR